MAQDGFTDMIDSANTFFEQLAQNNRRDWFNPRKADYNEQIKKPAKLFASLLAEDISRSTGKTYAPKVFRINRDVRFSKDKTPYNAHLHILWSSKTAHPLTPSFFFGSDPKRLEFACGIMDIKGDHMRKFRAAIDADGDALTAAIEATGMSFSSWGHAPLKRVPTPYDADHPHAELLKRKSLILSSPLGTTWRKDERGLIGAVQDTLKAANPLISFLDGHFS